MILKNNKYVSNYMAKINKYIYKIYNKIYNLLN